MPFSAIVIIIICTYRAYLQLSAIWQCVCVCVNGAHSLTHADAQFMAFDSKFEINPVGRESSVCVERGLSCIALSECALGVCMAASVWTHKIQQPNGIIIRRSMSIPYSSIQIRWQQCGELTALQQIHPNETTTQMSPAERKCMYT